jgi:hypothetical protein
VAISRLARLVLRGTFLAHSAQMLGDRLVADPMAALAQLAGERAHTLRRPAQRRDGVATGIVIHEFQAVIDVSSLLACPHQNNLINS